MKTPYSHLYLEHMEMLHVCFGVLLVWVIMSVLLLLAVLLAEKMNIHKVHMWKHRFLKAQSIPYHPCTIYSTYIWLPFYGKCRWICRTMDAMGMLHLMGLRKHLGYVHANSWLYHLNPYCNWGEWFVAFTGVKGLIHNYVRISAPYCTTLIL